MSRRRPAPPRGDQAADRAVALVDAVRGALALARSLRDLAELRDALDATAADLDQLAALLAEDLDGAATLATWATVSPSEGPGEIPERWIWMQRRAIDAFREALPEPAARAFKMPGRGASSRERQRAGGRPREPGGPSIPTCIIGGP